MLTIEPSTACLDIATTNPSMQIGHLKLVGQPLATTQAVPSSSASMSPDYYGLPPSPPPSLKDQVHVAYAVPFSGFLASLDDKLVPNPIQVQSSSPSSSNPPITCHASLGTFSVSSRDQASATQITLWHASSASDNQHEP